MAGGFSSSKNHAMRWVPDVARQYFAGLSRTKTRPMYFGPPTLVRSSKSFTVPTRRMLKTSFLHDVVVSKSARVFMRPSGRTGSVSMFLNPTFPDCVYASPELPSTIAVRAPSEYATVARARCAPQLNVSNRLYDRRRSTSVVRIWALNCDGSVGIGNAVCRGAAVGSAVGADGTAGDAGADALQVPRGRNASADAVLGTIQKTFPCSSTGYAPSSPHVPSSEKCSSVPPTRDTDQSLATTHSTVARQ
mmetsp:Transcript_10318/g.31918  ORF Transcript_10318/g.31918 Transcript_10318/m.31918 type:complete len:248 (-) Transcript_10318:495-1238(-)